MLHVQKVPGTKRGGLSVVWAWVCVALSPVGTMAAVAAGQSGLGVPSSSLVNAVFGGAVVVLLFVGPAAAAVYFAVRAWRARQRSALAALVVSALVLAFLVVALAGEVLQAFAA